MRKEYRINELESYQDEISIKLSDRFKYERRSQNNDLFYSRYAFWSCEYSKNVRVAYPDIESMNEAMIEA